HEGEVEGRRIKLGYEIMPDFGDVHIYALHETVDDRLSLENDPETAYDESLKTSNLTHRRVEASSNFALGNSHLATVGAVFDHNSLSQENTTAIDESSSLTIVEVDDKKAQTLEAYAQDDWVWGKGHELVSGLRYTHDQYFGDNFAPKINYSK